MPYEPSIRFYFDATPLRKRIEHIIRGMERFPEERQAAIDAIVRHGIRENLRILGRGGSVQTPGGGAYAWNQVRHKWTVAVRRGFLGPGRAERPILHFTGKLQSRIDKGSFRAGTRSIRYRVPSDIEDLVRVHQLGLAPLPSLRNPRRHNPVKRVPPRQILLWSKAMVDDIVREAGKYGERLGKGER